MTDHDFTELLNLARSKGAVARMFHPLMLVITTPEYAAQAPGITEIRTEQTLPLPVSEASGLPLSQP